MSGHKTERLLNLVICLLSTRQFLSKEQIRLAVPQYEECRTVEAFDRMFERDKDELRDLGVPLETGSNSAWFEDEVGYRIDRVVLRLARDPVRAGRARRPRSRLAGLGPGQPGRPGVASAAQAQGGRRRARRLVDDRPGAASPHQRAVLPGHVRGRARPAAGHVPVPHTGAGGAGDPAPRALGRRLPARALVRRRVRPRPRRRASVPPVPRRWAGPPGRQAGRGRGPGRHRPALDGRGLRPTGATRRGGPAGPDRCRAHAPSAGQVVRTVIGRGVGLPDGGLRRRRAARR